jgi:hypothetical protein
LGLDAGVRLTGVIALYLDGGFKIFSRVSQDKTPD